MNTLIELTEEQRLLLLDLLQRDRNDLPGELHHSDSREMRSELQQRMRMEDDLLKCLQQVGQLI